MNNLKSQRGKISPYQIFSVLFVSRIVVSLTYVQTVSVGKLGADFLFSIAISFLLTMLLSAPIIISIKKGKSPALKMLYSVYFIWLVSLNITRFSYFTSSRISASSSMAFFIAIIIISACYCACLGIEGISRFGAFCAVLLVLTVGVVLVFNVHNLAEINYYPVEQNKNFDVLKNALIMTSNSTEPALLFILSDRINGTKIKPLLASISASYLTVFLLIFFVVGVLGASASMQAYPIFTLFQMASIGSFSRLDMLHTAFWVLALLLKSSIYIYASSITIKRFSHRKKCVGISAIILGLSMLIVFVFGTAMVEITKYASVISFVIFVVVLPFISIFTRGNSIEKS